MLAGPRCPACGALAALGGGAGAAAGTAATPAGAAVAPGHPAAAMYPPPYAHAYPPPYAPMHAPMYPPPYGVGFRHPAPPPTALTTLVIVGNCFGALLAGLIVVAIVGSGFEDTRDRVAFVPMLATAAAAVVGTVGLARMRPWGALTSCVLWGAVTAALFLDAGLTTKDDRGGLAGLAIVTLIGALLAGLALPKVRAHRRWLDAAANAAMAPHRPS